VNPRDVPSEHGQALFPAGFWWRFSGPKASQLHPLGSNEGILEYQERKGPKFTLARFEDE